MPLEMRFVEGGRGVEFVSSGTVTGQEIVDANEKLYTPGNLHRLKYKLIDRTACTDYRVTSRDIRAIADQDKVAAATNPNIIVVLVSTTPLQHGMTRMWQAYTEDTGFHTEMFQDRASAVAWLRAHIGDAGPDGPPDVDGPPDHAEKHD